jgi:hypothetical protein
MDLSRGNGEYTARSEDLVSGLDRSGSLVVPDTQGEYQICYTL